MLSVKQHKTAPQRVQRQVTEFNTEWIIQTDMQDRRREKTGRGGGAWHTVNIIRKQIQF